MTLKTEKANEKVSTAFLRVALTFRPDANSMHFGDSIMLKNNQTNGILVGNPSEKMVSTDEAYAVTAAVDVGACARSVFKIIKANPKDGLDNTIRYGQDLHLVSVDEFMSKPLYLQSLPISPMVYSRYTRN